MMMAEENNETFASRMKGMKARVMCATKDTTFDGGVHFLTCYVCCDILMYKCLFAVLLR